MEEKPKHQQTDHNVGGAELVADRPQQFALRLFAVHSDVVQRHRLQALEVEVQLRGRHLMTLRRLYNTGGWLDEQLENVGEEND